MMEGFTIIQHNREKDPVDNRISEAICSALQETRGNNSKPVCLDSFAGVGGFELSLDEKGGSFRGLFKNKDELYEALDDLDENNHESSACIESKIEIIFFIITLPPQFLQFLHRQYLLLYLLLLLLDLRIHLLQEELHLHLQYLQQVL